MLTKVIFVVVIILPSGDFATKAEVVQACPSIRDIGDFYEQKISKGLIREWNATCFTLNFEEKEAT